MRKILLIFAIILVINTRFGEPFSILATGVVVGGFGAAYKWFGIDCLFKECCTDSYIRLDTAGLKRDLTTKLHGQHLVTNTVLRSVKAHAYDANPSKPLVLSFHGWTGVGKNYVSRIITQNLYREKEKSSFVHWLNSEIHFKHKDKVNEYKDQLHSWIYHNVSNCQRSVFVFDEMDHMPEGMIDVLVPFLGHNTHIDNVDFRKAIFIFLSNTGGDMINQAVLQTWESGNTRDSLQLRDMQAILEMSAYNSMSGLRRSKLVHKQLIDHFIPFLPLERRHVRLCIFDELRRKNVTEYEESEIEEVLDELHWFPKEINLFSRAGCKKIDKKVDVVFDV